MLYQCKAKEDVSVLVTTAEGAEVHPDGIDAGHLSDDEAEGGKAKEKKKKKLKKMKKKKVQMSVPIGSQTLVSQQCVWALKEGLMFAIFIFCCRFLMVIPQTVRMTKRRQRRRTRTRRRRTKR